MKKALEMLIEQLTHALNGSHSPDCSHVLQPDGMCPCGLIPHDTPVRVQTESELLYLLQRQALELPVHIETTVVTKVRGRYGNYETEKPIELIPDEEPVTLRIVINP